MENTDFSEDIRNKIRSVFDKVHAGEISLLDYELVPIFQELKDSLNTSNLDNYSKTYVEACNLLDKKFEELKELLNSLDEEKKFLEYLESEPSDSEISALFMDCWIKTFHSPILSYNFLEESKDRLIRERTSPLVIEHLQAEKSNEKFILELPKHKFTEKMMNFFETIKDTLPCSFYEVFGEETNQLELYKQFVYLLHLLQIGKIQYQMETNTLYLGGE
ncbi:MAG: hypothetical protein GF311_18570 [Candidatus Lokiarchaeota archaeon]|nr:hypothetical protein [Candidatus Lokiarchaeota archaeon]